MQIEESPNEHIPNILDENFSSGFKSQYFYPFHKETLRSTPWSMTFNPQFSQYIDPIQTENRFEQKIESNMTETIIHNPFNRHRVCPTCKIPIRYESNQENYKVREEKFPYERIKKKKIVTNNPYFIN